MSIARRLSLYYTQYGKPTDVLRALSAPSLPSPKSGTVNLKIRLAPINPADLNVIEGVYPAKPSLDKSFTDAGVYVPGNECVAQVTHIGNDVVDINVGDWVIMAKAQSGTWTTHRNVKGSDVLKVPSPTTSLTDVHLATMSVRLTCLLVSAVTDLQQVNPPTAHNMLTEFTDLKPGDWVVQNGANSAVRIPTIP
jgi:trans-2-enoyl-CoA reductase